MTISDNVYLKNAVDSIISNAKITDIHTHLFSTNFQDLLLWGIDELLTYHYLVAEAMRHTNLPYSTFWGMTKKEQADFIWDTLFIKNTPYSEACRGVLTVINKLGLDVKSRNIDSFRNYFKTLSTEEYIEKVFSISGVNEVIMTNDPFEDNERKVWLDGYHGDHRFKAALRIDPLLNYYDKSYEKIIAAGYNVSDELSTQTIKEITRFISDWIDKMNAVYMAVSLPPTFCFPENSKRAKIIEECVLPVCYKKGIPFAMMIGVKKLINPKLKLAGDGVGKASIDTVEYLCSKYPHNKFMVTMLSRENQHELCVAARKFRNLLPFGCWWFLNNPSIIKEMTSERIELLGSSFVPQHSDARVLDQLIYKWTHSKKIIGDVLYQKYSDILATGWHIEENEIERDVNKLFSGTFKDFLKLKL